MKKMIFSVFTLMLMTAAANAQTAEVKDAPQATNAPAAQAAPAPQATPAAQSAPAAQSTAAQATAARQGEGKAKVEIKDLPATVQAAIASDEYKGWTPTAAWHVKGTPEHYAIEMRKGEETTTVKLDKDGKKVG